MIKKINLPLTKDKVKELKAGDVVHISGVMYIARDQAHKKMVETINSCENLPFEIKDATIYYAGPAPTKDNQVINSVGPTSSYRMDPFAEILMIKGLNGMIGKGSRSEELQDQLKKYIAVYFTAVGGAAALIAKSIIKHDVIAYEELGAEALRRIEVKDFPCIVGYDCFRNSIIK